MRLLIPEIRKVVMEHTTICPEVLTREDRVAIVIFDLDLPSRKECREINNALQKFGKANPNYFRQENHIMYCIVACNEKKPP